MSEERKVKDLFLDGKECYVVRIPSDVYHSMDNVKTSKKWFKKFVKFMKKLLR